MDSLTKMIGHQSQTCNSLTMMHLSGVLLSGETCVGVAPV